MRPFPANRILEHNCGNRPRIIQRPTTEALVMAGAQRVVVEVLKLTDGEVLTEYKIEGTLTGGDALALLATFAGRGTP